MGRTSKGKRDPYGAWLKHLRKERGLTQQALSAEIGVPQSTIAYWESSGKLAGREIILKLSKALKVPLDDLLRSGK